MVIFPFSGGLNGDDFYLGDEEEFNGPGYGEQYGKLSFIKDEWYYHINVYVKLIHKTEKAYLVEDEKGQYWIPKKLLNLKERKQYAKFEVKYIKQ